MVSGSILHGCFSHVALEEAVEVGDVGEAAGFGYLCDGHFAFLQHFRCLADTVAVQIDQWRIPHLL